MNALEQFALGGQCLARAARASRQRVLWAPWAARLGLQWGILALLAWAAHPWFSGLMAPAVRALAGDEALRFPELFRRLPRLLEVADRLLAVLLTPVLAGVSTRLFERRWSRLPLEPGRAWREGFASAPALVLCSLPVTLVALLLELALGQLPGIRLSGFTRALAPRVVALFRGFVEAAFAYAPALVILERRGLGFALAAIPRTWRRGLVPALMVCAFAAILAWPFDALLLRSESLIDHDAPEAIALVLAGRELVRALAGFLVSGAITLAYLSAARPSRGKR